MPIITITFDAAPALSPEPTANAAPASRTKATTARNIIRSFGLFADLPEQDQRNLWRTSSAIIRAQKRVHFTIFSGGDAA